MSSALPIAILVSDIHLSHKPPIARSAEPDWYAAMKRHLDQLKAFAGDLPVICAGDIFDKWNSPPELINFAIANLPKMYAVPGQHDLPQHRYDARHRSAYGTLVAAGVVHDLSPDKPTRIEHPEGVMDLHAYPWGDGLATDATDDYALNVAVVHHYLWIKGKGYHGANKADRVNAHRNFFKAYNAAVFGDNHIGFSCSVEGCSVLNNGGFMCRTIDQMDYTPGFGVLFADGKIARQWLDTTEDKWLDLTDALQALESLGEMGGFIEELEQLGKHGLNFIEAVIRFMDKNKVAQSVRELVLAAIET